MFGRVFWYFIKLSKLFSRANLYTWLKKEIDILENKQESLLSVLNVGAGGEAYKFLKHLRGAKIIQIDIDPDRKPDVVVDVCNLQNFEENSFDAIFMIEVLEHVKEPQQAINQLYRVLKPGGTLILSVPFVIPIHDEPYDFFRYTKYGLEYLLQNYAHVVIRERNTYVHSIIVLAARAIMAKRKSQKIIGTAIFIYILIQYPVLWIFSKLYSNPQATSGYFVTAKKQAGK